MQHPRPSPFRLTIDTGEPRRLSHAQRIAGAVALTALALGGTLVIQPLIGSEPSMLFVLAVALATRYCGRGAGLLAAALSLLALDFYFVPPLGAIELTHPTQLMHLAIFLIVCLIIGQSTEALRAARDSAEHVGTAAVRLQQVTSALSEAQTAAEVADVALDAGLAALQATRGYMMVLSSDGTDLELFDQRGYPTEMLTSLARLPITATFPVCEAVRSRAPVWVDSSEDLRNRFPDAATHITPSVRLRAFAALPLTYRSEVLGALAASFAEDTAFGATDQAFTQLLAQATSAALQRARTFDAEQQRRRDAELTAKAREDVLGVVAHDLRNPMNLLANTAQLLAEDHVDAEQRAQLRGVADRAVKRMNRLVGDLLDVVRLQAGRLSMQVSDVDIRVLLRQAEETFRALASTKGVLLEITMPPEATIVRADEQRAGQILDNLIGNALKFTPTGGRISVSTELAGGEVRTDVMDTGPGLSADQIRHIFDAFWQARDGDRRGVGLGLAITKGIVEAHNGRLSVDSAPGKGSTFSFTIPRAGAATSAQSLALPPRPTGAGPGK